MAGQVFPQAQSGGANDDAIGALKAIAFSIAQLSDQFNGLRQLSGTFGQFLFPAAATVVVPNPNIRTGPASLVFLQAANLSAGTLVGSNESPIVSTADYVDGVSFTVRTAAATAAAGTEIFNYWILNGV